MYQVLIISKRKIFNTWEKRVSVPLLSIADRQAIHTFVSKAKPRMTFTLQHTASLTGKCILFYGYNITHSRG